MRIAPVAFILPAALGPALSAFAAEYLTIPAAQKTLFPEADRFVEAMLHLTDAQRSAIRKLSGVRQREAVQKVWRAQKQDRLLGWFIVDDVVGKHEFITYAAGIAPPGTLLGIEVLVYRETYGGEVRGTAWRRQFKGKTLADPFELDQDISNIPGATLSSRNLMNGAKRLLAVAQIALQPG